MPVGAPRRRRARSRQATAGARIIHRGFGDGGMGGGRTAAPLTPLCCVGRAVHAIAVDYELAPSTATEVGPAAGGVPDEDGRPPAHPSGWTKRGSVGQLFFFFFQLLAYRYTPCPTPAPPSPPGHPPTPRTSPPRRAAGLTRGDAASPSRPPPPPPPRTHCRYRHALPRPDRDGAVAPTPPPQKTKKKRERVVATLPRLRHTWAHVGRASVGGRRGDGRGRRDHRRTREPGQGPPPLRSASPPFEVMGRHGGGGRVRLVAAPHAHCRAP